MQASTVYLASMAINRLDVPGIIAGLKWRFPARTMPFSVT